VYSSHAVTDLPAIEAHTETAMSHSSAEATLFWFLLTLLLMVPWLMLA
jgi:hypothetical protein